MRGFFVCNKDVTENFCIYGKSTIFAVLRSGNAAQLRKFNDIQK